MLPNWNVSKFLFCPAESHWSALFIPPEPFKNYLTKRNGYEKGITHPKMVGDVLGCIKTGLGNKTSNYYKNSQEFTSTYNEFNEKQCKEKDEIVYKNTTLYYN